jgi:hypothetical protein
MSPVPTVLRARSASPAPAIAVECIDDRWRFTGLCHEWNELLRNSAADCPFLTWEWLNAWWMHFGAGSALRIVTVRDGGELIAIAPLREPASSVKWMSRLEFLGTGDVGSDYLDMIVASGREPEAIAALAQFARARHTALRLNHLLPGSTAEAVAEQLSLEGWTSASAADGVCPFIRLAGHTWDSYLATIGSSTAPTCGGGSEDSNSGSRSDSSVSPTTRRDATRSTRSPASTIGGTSAVADRPRFRRRPCWPSTTRSPGAASSADGCVSMCCA